MRRSGWVRQLLVAVVLAAALAVVPMLLERGAVAATPGLAFPITLSVGVFGSGHVVAYPPGLLCRAQHPFCSRAYRKGASVRLVAIPDQYAAFQSWGNACASHNPTCVVRMSRARFVVAYFSFGG